MANLTVTIAVSTGTQYQTGSTGSIYTFDGSQPTSFTFPWVNGGTVRLDQSGSTNDNHPLIFSTSNSTSTSTMRAGIISSGVTYYLDGSSNQSDYTNTTTFNAATTRYIEITPSSETDFYFACYVHGIGMGGIVDLTQNTFGALGWSSGAWNQQNDSDISLTGLGLTSSIGEVTAYHNSGWGRLTWGEYVWGADYLNAEVDVTGLGLTSSLGDETAEGTIEKGWGRGSWGNRAWGDTYSVLPTGVSATASVGNVGITADSIHELVTGLGMTASVGSIPGTFAITPLGLSMTSAVGTASVLSGEVVPVTGQAMTITLGAAAVKGGTIAKPDGFGLTASLGDETAYTDVTIPLTGFGLSASLGIIRQESGYPVVGLGLTSSLGSVSIDGKAVVTPTGLGMTIGTGGTAFAWSPVDKGSTVSYSEVSKGTTVTWSEVDKTAA
jgi:hypothetical protein